MINLCLEVTIQSFDLPEVIASADFPFIVNKK